MFKIQVATVAVVGDSVENLSMVNVTDTGYAAVMQDDVDATATMVNAAMVNEEDVSKNVTNTNAEDFVDVFTFILTVDIFAMRKK